MGLDGFSMGNLGLNTELTATQLASQVEFSTQKEAEIKIRDPEESAEDAAVKEKQEQERQQEFNDGFEQSSESEEDSTEEDDDEQEKQRQQEFESKDVKEFSIKINPQTETVEIYNRETGRTLETMNAKDLNHLVSKLDTASGVLINRKI